MNTAVWPTVTRTVSLQPQHYGDLTFGITLVIRSNRRLTIREISEDLNIAYGSVQNILTTDLNMRRVSGKFVPCVLTVEQKQQRFSISLELRDRAASDSSFLGNVIMGDDTWGLWL